MKIWLTSLIAAVAMLFVTAKPADATVVRVGHGVGFNRVAFVGHNGFGYGGFGYRSFGFGYGGYGVAAYPVAIPYAAVAYPVAAAYPVAVPVAATPITYQAPVAEPYCPPAMAAAVFAAPVYNYGVGSYGVGFGGYGVGFGGYGFNRVGFGGYGVGFGFNRVGFGGYGVGFGFNRVGFGFNRNVVVVNRGFGFNRVGANVVVRNGIFGNRVAIRVR